MPRCVSFLVRLFLTTCSIRLCPLAVPGSRGCNSKQSFQCRLWRWSFPPECFAAVLFICFPRRGSSVPLGRCQGQSHPLRFLPSHDGVPVQHALFTAPSRGAELHCCHKRKAKGSSGGGIRHAPLPLNIPTTARKVQRSWPPAFCWTRPNSRASISVSSVSVRYVRAMMATHLPQCLPMAIVSRKLIVLS